MEDSHTFISCKICLFPYDDHERCPKIIPCGHTICNDCFQNIQKKDKIQCPMCKKEFTNIKEIPVNFEILNLLNTRRIDHICPKHKNENLNFFCTNDKMLICQHCLLNEHIGHQIVKPHDSEISSSIKFAVSFKDFYSDFKSLKYNHQNTLKDHFKILDERFENINKNLKEVKDLLKFQFYVEQNKTNKQIQDLEILEKKVKEQYEEMKSGKKLNFSDEILFAYEEHKLYFKSLKDKELTLEKNENFISVKACLDELTHIKNKIMQSTDISELKRPEYDDIDNILEYLLDGRIVSIRYNSSKSSNEHKKLIDKSSVNTNCNSEFVINLMKSIDRVDFAPSNSFHVYSDMPMIIGWNTTISAPHMHLLTLYHLSNYVDKFKDKNLSAIDIGCGSGYMTICLAKLLGPFSTSIGLDHIQEIVDFSRTNIMKKHKHMVDSGRIKFVCKEGREGHKEGAPYHIIHVGAAVEEIPKMLIDQLAPGGILWIPVGPKGDYKKIILLQKDSEAKIIKQELMSVSYAEMVSVQEQLKINSDHEMDDDF
jgi:protein-L-isoaspartate(D-aspartate) O-methyltransferase